MNAQRRLVAMAVVFIAAAVSAQRPAPQIGESVQVTIVEVPVTVVGSDGKAVRNLTREQFELFDEGKRVPLEHFEVLDMKMIAMGQRKGALPPAAVRNFLLLFDFANSSPGAIARAAEAASEFVDEQLAGPDLAAVAVFSAETGARMVTGFTNDRGLLKSAVGTLGTMQYFKVSDPLMISFNATSIVRQDPGPTGQGSQPSGPGAEVGAAISGGRADVEEDMNAVTRMVNKAAQTAQNTELRNRLRIQLSQMGTVARTLDRLQGRKQIILLSEGFDARLVQGTEDRSLSSAKNREANDAAISGEIWNVDSDQVYGSASASRDVNEMTALFRRSDVVLHAIDIKGIRGSVDASAAHERTTGRSNEALFLLTRPTGGTVFENANDLEKMFERMLEQQEVVYLLAFPAKSSGQPGKFHSLKVKVDAPGARVAHRAGYHEPSDRLTQIEKTLSLNEILMTGAPVNDIGMSIATTALPGPLVEKARVPVVVELPGPQFLEGVRALQATANLFIYAFDKDNRVQDHLTQRITLHLVEAAPVVKAGGIRYYGTLHLAPGEYAVKAIVRVEESGRVGSVRSDIRVPNFENAAVTQPLFLAEPEKWVMLVGATRGDDYAYPFNAGETQYVPRARPVLAPGTAHRLAIFLHRMPAEDLGVTPVLVGNGTVSPVDVKLVGRTAADANGSSKLLFDYTPAGLRRGAYELRFTVKSKEGTESVVTLPFRVL
ncbi:MAG TPA: VWA domain-containing protein [Thermoanaerobaculia bacterium]|nr:VWA domain-containing protein [Thermoanaerobaculia bacterium]